MPFPLSNRAVFSKQTILEKIASRRQKYQDNRVKMKALQTMIRQARKTIIWRKTGVKFVFLI